MALSGLLFLMLAIVVAVIGTVGWQVRRLLSAAVRVTARSRSTNMRSQNIEDAPPSCSVA